MNEETPVKDLHTSLVKQGVKLPEYDVFEKDMQDPAKSAALHKSLSSQGVKLPPVDQFVKDMAGSSAQPESWSEKFGNELKKKDEAKKELASSQDFVHSSPVAAQTAPAAYLPDTKKNIKAQEAADKLTSFYDKNSVLDDINDEGKDIKVDRPITLEGAYKDWLESNGQGDALRFREQKVNNEQYKAETTVLGRLFHPDESWKGPEDPFSAKDSRESYNLFREAYNFKSQLLKTKLDQLHADPVSSTALDQAYSAQGTLDAIDQIQKTGMYNGKPVTDKEYSAAIANKSIYQNQIADLKARPEGAAAFKLIDNINSLDKDEEKYNKTFGRFIEEDKAKAAEQDRVDKLYSDAPWFVKGAFAITAPVGRVATDFAAKLLTVQNTWKLGSKEFYTSGEEWKDRVNNWKTGIDNEIFPQPRQFDDPAFKYSGGNVRLYDDEGNLKPDVTLPKSVSVNTGSLIPQVTKTFAECVALVAPAGASQKAALALGVSKSILGADLGYSVGLLSSSYVNKYTELFDAGIAAGMSRENAASHARTGSVIEASLELVSPQRAMFGTRTAEEVTKTLAKGGAQTVAKGLGFAAKETGGEVIQESLQSMGDFANQAYRNKSLGKQYFDADMNKLATELGQVIPLTAIMAGSTSGVHAVHNPLYAEAVRGAATDPSIMPRLLAQFKDNKTDPAVIKQVLQDIGSVVKYDEGQTGYVNKTHNVPLTKEQAQQMIADGNVGDIAIYNDPEMEAALVQKHQELSIKREQEVLKGATKLVKNDDGVYDIVLKSDPTKKVGFIKDGVTTRLDEKGEPVSHPIDTPSGVKDGPPVSTIPDKISSIDDLIRDNQIAEVTPEQAKIMMADKTNPLNSKLGRVITNVQSAMKNISPNARLVMLNNQQHAVDVAKKLGYTVNEGDAIKGFYDQNTQTAFFVKNPNTTIHEAAIHPIIDMVKKESPERYQEFVDEIGAIKSGFDTDGNGKYYLKDAQKNYKGESKELQSEEAIAHFLTDIAEGKFRDKPAITRVVEAIKKFLGINPKEMMINLNDPQTLQDFAGQIATALSNGQPITIKTDEAPSQKKSEVKFENETQTDLTTEEKQGLKFQIEAMHGSPNLFDHFETDKIGQGYGANKFGWGLYFTEKEGIAKNYAAIPYVGKVLPKFFNKFVAKDGVDVAKKLAEDFSGESDLYKKDLEAKSKKLFNNGKAADELSMLTELEKAIASEGKGRVLYNVDIHKGKSPDEYDYLKWTDVLSPEQVAKIKSLGVNITPETTGAEVYNELAQKAGSQKAASNMLLDSGIDGIKYPVEGVKKSDASGHNNIVVFDPRAVSISQAVRFQKEAGEHNGVKINRTTDAQEYHNAIKVAASKRTDDGVQVDVKSPEDYKEIIDNGGKLYLSEDKKFGAMVKADGYMGSLFKHPDSPEKGVSKTLQDIRVKDGGRFFDAFGTHLEKIYAKNGFEPVARLPFNEEFAPHGWQDTVLKSKPDVVFFAYNPNGDFKIGDGQKFDDFDKAYTFAKDKADEYAKERDASTEGDKTGQSGQPSGSDVSSPRFSKESYGANGTTGEEEIRNGESQSTRIPTSVRAEKRIGDHAGPVPLSTNLADQRLAPASYVKNAILVSDYPELQGEFKDVADKMAERVQVNDNKVLPEDIATADKIFAKLKSSMVDNLNWLHDKFPSHIRERAKTWYDGANRLAQRMAKNNDISHEQASAVFAVLSPQKDWYMNVSLGERVTDIVKNQQSSKVNDVMTKRILKAAKSLKNTTGINPTAFKAIKRAAVAEAQAFAEQSGRSLSEIEDPKFKAMFVRAFDEINNDRSYNVINPEGSKGPIYKTNNNENGDVAWGSYSPIMKAISILADGSKENISDQLGAEHKVRNFYNNISNPNSGRGEVTIDTHATAAAHLQPFSGNDAEVGRVFGSSRGSSGSKFNGISGVYPVVADAYREAAHKNGLLPRELQSITWEAVRSLFPSSFKSNKNNVGLIRKIWDEYKNKNITIDELRDAITEVANPVWEPDWVGSDSGQHDNARQAADAGRVHPNRLPSGQSSPLSTAGRNDRPVSALVSRLTGNEPRFSKVNNTTKRVVEPEKTPFQDLRDQYLKDPQSEAFSYEPQSIKDELANLAGMSQPDLLANLDKKGTNTLLSVLDQLKPTDNFGLLGAIELLKHAHTNGDAALESMVYSKVKSLGSGVGQLLRQMRELYTMFPKALNKQSRMASDRDLIRKIIMKQYQSEGIHLPDDMKLDLDNQINNYIAAHELETTAKEKLTASPTAENYDAHEKAVKYTDGKFYDIMSFIDSTLPVSLGDTAMTIVKGNLLTVGSIAINTVSNLANTVNQAAIEGHTASLFGEASKAIAGEKSSWRPATSMMGMAHALGTFVKAWGPAFREAFSNGGMRSRELSKFEVQRQLHPLTAFKQAFLPNNSLPKRVVNKNGRATYETTAGIWAAKALEGTFGWPAAFFYRSLYLTDKPFSEAAKTFSGFLEFKSQHPDGNASEFGQFMANLDPKAKERIQHYANKFTYNDPEGWFAKTATTIVGSVDKAADALDKSLDEYSENKNVASKAFAQSMKIVPSIYRAVKTATVPYVGVPSNVAQHLLELAIPVVPLIGAVHHHKAGNHRIAGMMVGRALTGLTLYSVASTLANAGLFIDNDDDPKLEKNDTQLKHAVARPSAINLSGLIRLWAGESTEWRDGDRSVNMQKLGMAGVFFNYYANFNQAMGEKKMSDFNANMLDSFVQAGGSATKMLFSMSFLNGAQSLMESIAGADKEGAAGVTAFTAKEAETLSNLVWPNQLAQVHQAGTENLMRASDPTLLGNIREKMAKRGFYFGALSTDKLNPVLDIWGQPIPIKAADVLNPLQLEVATDQEAIKVFNIMNETHADNPITIPQNQIKLSAEDGIDGIDTDTTMKLNEEDYLVLQSLVGRFKKAYLRSDFADKDFDKQSVEDKLQQIRETNNDANTAGRELFLDMFYQDIERGNIKFDALHGTYERKNQPHYDPAQDERLIGDDGSEIPQK